MIYTPQKGKDSLKILQYFFCNFLERGLASILKSDDALNKINITVFENVISWQKPVWNILCYISNNVAVGNKCRHVLWLIYAALAFQMKETYAYVNNLEETIFLLRMSQSEIHTFKADVLLFWRTWGKWINKIISKWLTADVLKAS